MAKDKDSSSCLGCSKKFTKSDFCLQCTVCGLWSHKTCSGATDEVFNLLEIQKKNTGRSYWACRPCIVYAEGMNHRLRQMEERIDKVEKETETTKKTVKNMEEKIQELSEEVKKKDKGVSKAIQEGENNVFEELKERETRKLNVVFHRVGECENERASGQERKEWDLDSCGNIFKTMKLNLSSEAVKFVRRVGAKGENARPMIVGFHSDETRRRVLSGARELQATFFKDVSIVPDLTKRQRDDEEELKNLASRRNNELTEDDRAKNLEWLVVGMRGERRLIKAVPRTQLTKQVHRQPEDRTHTDRPLQQVIRPRLNSKRRREERIDLDGEEEEEDEESQPTQRGRLTEN